MERSVKVWGERGWVQEKVRGSAGGEGRLVVLQKQKAAYGVVRSLVGSGMCRRESNWTPPAHQFRPMGLINFCCLPYIGVKMGYHAVAQGVIGPYDTKLRLNMCYIVSMSHITHFVYPISRKFWGFLVFLEQFLSQNIAEPIKPPPPIEPPPLISHMAKHYVTNLATWGSIGRLTVLALLLFLNYRYTFQLISYFGFLAGTEGTNYYNCNESK